MKKFVVAGLLAIGLMATTRQEASAWINARFGIGLNWDLQSGGNQFGWGLWRNGQPPGPEAFGGGGHHGGGYGPQFGAPMPQHHGYAPMPQQYQPYPQAYVPQQYAPAPRAYSTAEPPITAQPVYYNSPYQFASYPRPVYYYYYTTPYYYYYGQ
jgi:hypothetical protein